MSIGASNLAGERIPFFERGHVPRASGIFEGAVVVATTTSGDNLEVDLPNSAYALNGGRNYVGVSASQGTTIVSSSTLPSDNQITVQRAGVAKCALKASTACEKYAPAGFDPADGGYIVPHVSGKTICIGRFTQSKSSSASAQMVGVWLDEGAGAGMGEMLIGAITSSSTAVSNTSSETAFDRSVSIPANLLSAGSVLRIRAKVNVTSGNGADTLTLRLKLGGNTISASAPIDVTDLGGDVGILDAEITVRSIGAAGVLVSAGVGGLGVPLTATIRVGCQAGTFTLDTTAAQSVTVTAQWSAMSASNSCQLEALVVSMLRASV